MLVNISMKFHENILNESGHDFFTETDTYKVQRGITKNNIYPRVMVLTLCTGRQTDRQRDRPDRQTDR